MAFESSEPLRFPGPTSLWKLSCAAWDLVSAAATRPPFFPCEIRAAQVGAQGVPAGHASLRCKIKFVTDRSFQTKTVYRQNPGPKGRRQWLNPVGQEHPFQSLPSGTTHGAPSMAKGHLGGGGAGRGGAGETPGGLRRPHPACCLVTTPTAPRWPRLASRARHRVMGAKGQSL